MRGKTRRLFLTSFLILLLGACVTQPKSPVRTQPVKSSEYQILSDSKVALINTVEPYVTHSHVGATIFNNFQKEYTVDWDLSSYIDNRVGEDIAKLGYRLIRIDGNEELNQKLQNLANCGFASCYLNSELDLDLQKLVEQYDMDVLIVIQTYESVAPGTLSKEYGYGIHTEDMFGTLGQAWAFAHLSAVLVYMKPPTLIALHSIQEGPLIKEFVFPKDLKSIPVEELSKAEPLVKDLVDELIDVLANDFKKGTNGHDQIYEETVSDRSGEAVTVAVKSDSVVDESGSGRGSRKNTAEIKKSKITESHIHDTKVAAKSDDTESIPKPDSRIKLAIFPYYMKSSPIGDGAIISPTNMKNTSIKSLNKVLRGQIEITPTYSYYELAKEFKAKKITERIINDKDVNKLWMKKSGSTILRKPNINLACEIGNKLKVDTVLLSSFTHKSGEPNWTMAIYFIDVETKKTFSQTTSIYFRTYQNEAYNFTERAFDAYGAKKFKSKSGSVSGDQIAAIPKFNVKEPWTGIWEVEGSHQEAKGIWGLKQRGKSVVSTKDSYFEVNGKVNGNQLEGRFIDSYNLSHRFVINISSDGQSFEGKIYRANQTIQVKGRRKQ